MQAVYIHLLPGLRGVQYPASVPWTHPANMVPSCTGCIAPQGMRPSTLGTGSTHHYPDSVCCPLPARVWIPCAGYAAVQAVNVYIYIYCQVSGEYNNLRVSIANALLRWYRSVQDVLPHRVCDLSPWELGVRMRTLPAYVIRCLQGYGYPVHGMWVCRLCKYIHFLY